MTGDGDELDANDGSRDDDTEDCDGCRGWDRDLIAAAIKYKAKGWDPERWDGYPDSGGYGVCGRCEGCGRDMAWDEADAAYAAAPGPDQPTVGSDDRVVATGQDAGLGADAARRLMQLFSGRPVT